MIKHFISSLLWRILCSGPYDTDLKFYDSYFSDILICQINSCLFKACSLCKLILSNLINVCFMHLFTIFFSSYKFTNNFSGLVRFRLLICSIKNLSLVSFYIFNFLCSLIIYTMRKLSLFPDSLTKQDVFRYSSPRSGTTL